jgi:hypothetical protein
MKYACLVYVDESLIGALSPQEGKRLIDESVDYDWGLRNNGHLILAQPLEMPHTAVTIRVRGGRMSSTDGPFAETKEHLGGFFLIEARDIEEAVALAKTSPMAAMGAIEIRPFLEQSHGETGQRRPELQR